MPIYEYRCEGCGKEHETLQSFSDEPLTICPDCGGPMKKLISSTSFVLKGAGWYADGYASTDRKKAIGKEGTALREKEASSSADKKAAGNSGSKAA